MEKKYNKFYKDKSVNIDSDNYINTAEKFPLDRVQSIIHSVNKLNKINVMLEVGCGDGDLLLALRGKYTKCIGLEYSRLRLERAGKKLKNIDFTGIKGSAEDMKIIPSNSIDCIVSADTIEHIPDVYSTADEMFRVLKPKGVIIINTPNIAFIKKRFQLLFGKFPSTSQPNEGFGDDIMYDGGHLHYFTFSSLSKLLTRSGFIVQELTGYGPLGFVHNIYPKLLSGGAQIVAVKPSPN